MDFRDRVVLITGASSGIGRQLAIDLATRGATVVGCGRSEERLQETLKEMRRTGPASSVHLCDVADPDQVRAMVQKILSDHGKIDILINNAGVGTYKSFVDSSSDSFESVWRTNFLGAVYCIKEVLPSMIRRRSGHIVNMASVAGKIGTPNMASYCASKFALVGLSESLYHELKPLGIHVSVVCPGRVRTEMPLVLELLASGLRLPDALVLTTEDVSRAVMRSVEKKKFEAVVPLWLALICSFKGLVPNTFQRTSKYVYALGMRLARSQRGKGASGGDRSGI